MIPYSEFQFDVTRSRGPGGQHVNKTNSAVVLRWSPSQTVAFSDEQKQRLIGKLNLNASGEVVIRSDTYRAQDQNKTSCLEKLDKLIEKAFLVQKKRLKTKPTQSSKIKRRESKKRRSDIKRSRQKNYQEEN